MGEVDGLDRNAQPQGKTDITDKTFFKIFFQTPSLDPDSVGPLCYTSSMNEMMMDLLEPTAADLAVEVDLSDDFSDLLTPRVVESDEDFWNEDDNVHDDRYDGRGIPSWSAWA